LLKESNNVIKNSVKYQVLCDQTAFVGIVKQKDKATGQMQEFAVEFGKKASVVVKQPAYAG
jgi:hypothetical protein